MTIYDLVGLVGVVMILLAYFLLQVGKLKLENISYSLLNFLGSVFIFVSLLFDWNLSAFFIEISWILISVYGIVKSIRVKASI